jgi:cytochrome c
MQTSRNNIRLRTLASNATSDLVKHNDGCSTFGLREDEMTALISSFVLSLLFVAMGPAEAQHSMPVGDSGSGALVFKKCMACHQVGPNAKNGIAPVLNGVVGRPAGQYPEYNYSSANKKSGLTWDEPTLARYLRAPSNVVPGTKMIFAGLKKEQEISDVIAYLKQFAPDGKQVGP